MPAEQRLRRPLDAQLDRKSGLPCVLDQFVEVLEARLRRECRCFLGAAKDADHLAHLGECLATGLLDDEERLTLLHLMWPEQAACRRGLDGHDADTVTDHVVQLARDPRTLVRDGEPRPLHPLPLGAGEALLRFLRLVELAPEREADRPGDREGDRGEDEVPDAALRIVVRDDRRHSDPQCEAGDRLRAVADQAEEHEHREGRQDGNESARGDPVVDEGARSEDDAHRGGRAEGETASREERHCAPEGEQDVEPERAARTVLRVPGDDDPGDLEADRGDDQRVEPVGPRQDPEPVAVHAPKVASASACRLGPEDDFSSPPRG